MNCTPEIAKFFCKELALSKKGLDYSSVRLGVFGVKDFTKVYTGDEPFDMKVRVCLAKLRRFYPQDFVIQREDKSFIKLSSSEVCVKDSKYFILDVDVYAYLALMESPFPSEMTVSFKETRFIYDYIKENIGLFVSSFESVDLVSDFIYRKNSPTEFSEQSLSDILEVPRKLSLKEIENGYQTH